MQWLNYLSVLILNQYTLIEARYTLNNTYE